MSISLPLPFSRQTIDDLLKGGALPHGVKKVVCRVALAALGVTFELCGRMVPEMHRELEGWREGLRVGIGVLPSGPDVTVKHLGGGFRYLGDGLQTPDVSILFKNLESAMLVFTAQIGAHTAVAEDRVIVRGPNDAAMAVTRAMAIVQTYLFPGVLLERTFKRPPRLGPRQLATKAAIMGLLVPELAKALRP